MLKTIRTGVTTKAFHFLQFTISFLEHHGVTISGLRDSYPITYKYSVDKVADEDIDTGLLWQYFYWRHKEIFTISDLRKAKQVIERGERPCANESKMLYIGTSDVCHNFVSKMLLSNNLH